MGHLYVMGLFFNFGEDDMVSKKTKADKKAKKKKTDGLKYLGRNMQKAAKDLKKVAEISQDETIRKTFFLADVVLDWDWDEKKKVWTFKSHKGENASFTPYVNRHDCAMLLMIASRFSIDKLAEETYFVRVELTNGKWAISVSKTECEAICEAFLSLANYK